MAEPHNIQHHLPNPPSLSELCSQLELFPATFWHSSLFVIWEISSERKSWRFLHQRQRMAYTEIPFQLTHQGAISSAEADCH